MYCKLCYDSQLATKVVRTMNKIFLEMKMIDIITVYRIVRESGTKVLI